jgi:hypothetical protein
MKIGVIIPDRNDRSELLKNCMRMLEAQTVQPDVVELVNYEPKTDKCDITQRYRTGYNNLRNKNLDAIFFIENDDFYHPTYIETMASKYINEGKPLLLGTAYTIYYNILINKWFKFQHLTRASAMNTVIKPDQQIDWGKDENPYTDAWLWNKHKGVIFEPQSVIAIGIKHGIGMQGGKFHLTDFDRYRENDQNMMFLKNHMDEKSFKFYKNLSNKLK